MEESLAERPPSAWRNLSAGDGATGPRLDDRAWLPDAGAALDWQKGLLVRRGRPEPKHLTLCPTHVPTATSLARWVQLDGSR